MSHDQKDARGSSYARRARRRWMLSPAAGFGGTRRAVPCFHCGRRLTPRAFDVDRYPLCGHDGGSYRRENIVPSCVPCNRGRCSGCVSEQEARGGLLSREKPDARYEEVYA
jgi:hypothetical protein